MNKDKRLMLKCTKSQDNNKSHLSVQEGIDNTTHMSNVNINKKNDNSPRNCHVLSTHSTPVGKQHSENKVEESPDFEYYSSPILLPCTQEGGNEVAWDWQSSSNKTSDSRNAREKVQCETPKRTKLLQKKRNSNSPLLYKPLKRKYIKKENIENIGQFAAELQAFHERMNSMKQDDKKDDDGVEENTVTVVNANNDEGLSEVKNDENYNKKNNDKDLSEVKNYENYNKKNNDCNNVNNATASYDDLFDDSIDDSMARCTQEIEEKFNLTSDKGNVDSTNVKEETSTHTINTTNQISSQNSQEFLGKSFFHTGIEDNNILKTYSNISKKRVNCINEISEMWKNKNQHKSWANNNKIHSHSEKSSNNEILSKNITSKLFDDSFDDCLATCIEDEKLLAVGSNDSSTRKNSNTKSGSNCESSTNVSSQRKIICNKFSSGTKSTNSVKAQTCSDTVLENRKFFKTKSLSDQYIGQDTSINIKKTSNSSISYNTMKSTLHLNSFKPKSSMTMHVNATRTSVSTNPMIMNTFKAEDSAITRDMGQTYELDVNRSVVKEGGNRFIRYNSTGNMKNEIRKTDRQPVRCTAEEIERKRLEAKNKLEAKKKLNSMKTPNHVINR